MSLNVQRTARLLGVSPHTVRRWTASGVLPCTRTPGGHRRIRREDALELAHLIGDDPTTTAQRAHEREFETFVDTVVALIGCRTPADLLSQIARRLTALLDCQFCAISDYDPAADTVVTLADCDADGRRLPRSGPYHLARYPLTRRVLEAQEAVVVNVSDPHADPDEVRELRRDGDKSLLMVPLVLAGRSVGLLELFDHRRERHYTRQELRLTRALAHIAAIALQNARAYAEAGVAQGTALVSPATAGRLTAALPSLIAAPHPAELLQRTAELACQVLHAASCVVTARSHPDDRRDPAPSLSAGATSTNVAEDTSDNQEVRLLKVAYPPAMPLDPARGSTSQGPAFSVSLTASLTGAARAGESEVLRLLAAVAASSLSRLAQTT